MRQDRKGGKKMKWWPYVGITKMITKDEEYKIDSNVKRLNIFKRSLHIFIIDVGNCNRLNFEIRALHTPKYNIHRFGIFFSASPRHADLLMVLGKPTQKMVDPLLETIEQMPNPFGIMLIKGCGTFGIDPEELNLPNVVSVMEGCPEPKEILANLLKISGRVD
jgi:Ni,Fe-hydrogenase III small subunit